MDDKFANF